MKDVNYKKASTFFKALSHPTRLRIVRELLQGRICVNDMGKLIKTKQPNISQHLTLLKLNDMVDWKQEGKLKCYFLKDRRLIAKLLNLFEK